jgi:hypothetical protein
LGWRLSLWQLPSVYSSLVWTVSPLSCLDRTYLSGEARQIPAPPVPPLGTGIIASAALWFHHQTGILPGILSLVAIFAGLALRIRAFLYLGTFTFVANAFYQLVILICPLSPA